MVVEEIISVDRVRHYSSDGKWIRQIESGMFFKNAVDVYPCPYQYTEYDGEPPYDRNETEEYAEAAKILLGEIS